MYIWYFSLLHDFTMSSKKLLNKLNHHEILKLEWNIEKTAMDESSTFDQAINRDV